MLRSVVDWSDGVITEIRVRHCSDHALSYAADRCPNLQVLAIRSIYDENSVSVQESKGTRYQFHDSLVVIGRNCPNLRTLKRNLMDWSDSSLYIGSVPAEYLDACSQDGDTEVDAIGKHMTNLEHLEIGFSRLSVKGLASICEGCSKLEYLDLFGCEDLSGRDITKNVSRLKWLKDLKKPEVYVPRSRDVLRQRDTDIGDSMTRDLIYKP